MYEEKEIKYKKRKKETFKLQKQSKRKKTDFFNKIDWKQLSIKLIILILFMILIIFIISRISKNSKEKDTIINQNINTIITKTIKFYNNQNLPHNVGDSTSLLLDEMVQKNIIEVMKDKQGKTCDLNNSYIIITKITEQDYRLKVYLTCPKENKTIEKNINCAEECIIKNS